MAVMCRRRLSSMPLMFLACVGVAQLGCFDLQHFGRAFVNSDPSAIEALYQKAHRVSNPVTAAKRTQMNARIGSEHTSAFPVDVESLTGSSRMAHAMFTMFAAMAIGIGAAMGPAMAEMPSTSMTPQEKAMVDVNWKAKVRQIEIDFNEEKRNIAVKYKADIDVVAKEFKDAGDGSIAKTKAINKLIEERDVLVRGAETRKAEALKKNLAEKMAAMENFEK